MTSADVSHNADEASTTSILAATLERWRLVATMAVAAIVVALAFLVIRGERYEAAVTLSTVVSSRSLPVGGSGLMASLLNLGGGSGLQSTPVLIVRISRSQSVALSVAQHTIPQESVTVIERLTGKTTGELSTRDIIRKMNRTLSASYDRESGLVTLRAVHKDSALVRALVEATVTELQRVFVQASRSQATELRRAQEVRLDSAEKQLRSAEANLTAFLSANRVIAPYSALQAQLQRQQRAVEIAQTVYLQVRTEREAAIGKELEETPAVVVLDALPARLPAIGAKRGAIILSAVFIGVFVAIVLIAVQEWAREPTRDPTGSRERLFRAVGRLPVVGPSASRFLQSSAR